MAAWFLACLACPSLALGASAPWTSITAPGATNTSLNPIPDIVWDGAGLWTTWGTDDVGVEVRRWDGSSWATYPRPAQETTRNKMPSITWDGSKPWVAWNDDSNAVRVASWGGASWSTITSPGSAGSQYSTPDLLWANGSLHVAYQDSGRVVRVKRWTGSAWTDLGSPGNGGTANSYPNLAWDGSQVWVAWSQPDVARVSRLVSGTWTAHSSLTVTGSGNTLPTLAFVGSRLYLTHEATSGIAIEWWDGAQYRSVPTPGGGPTVFAYGTLEWTGSRFWAAYVIDPDHVEIARYDPASPAAPTTLAQLQSDGSTAIAGGAWTPYGVVSALILRAMHSDAESGEQLTPWAEIQPSTGSFSATCGQQLAGATRVGSATAAPTGGVGVSAELSVTGLTNGLGYMWRTCTVDRFGFPSAWTARGGVPDLRMDSSVPTATPSLPASGATGVGLTPTLTVSYSDPAPANAGTAEIQVCSSSACSPALQSGTTTSTASGSTASWTVPSSLTPSTTYWWRARATDVAGNVGTWSATQSFTTEASTLTIGVDAATRAVGATAANVDAVATSVVTVTTNAPGGYQLVVRDESDTWAADASTGGVIADWTGTSATPTAWAAGVAGGMGMTVLSVTGPEPKAARWGTGTTATDFTNNRYAGLEATTDTVVHARPTYASAPDDITVAWRINRPADQLAGSYDATTAWTVVALP